MSTKATQATYLLTIYKQLDVITHEISFDWSLEFPTRNGSFLIDEDSDERIEYIISEKLRQLILRHERLTTAIKESE